MTVHFTVDTEFSMGGAWNYPELRPVGASRRVFCRIGDETFGIPLLTRILKSYGLQATFFVETLGTRCLGDPETRSIFDFLLAEGQDVQLHIHPNFRFYSDFHAARQAGLNYTIPSPRDLIGHLSEAIQMELLDEAITYFRTFTGRSPVAFRAGCWAGSNTMLRCLARLGISLDSSFHPCYHPEISFPDEPPRPNVLQRISGVWELPATVAVTKIPEGYKGFKGADCVALSFSEIRAMLDFYAAKGLRHFVIVFHSFSAVKSRDVTYADIRPDRIVIRRLEQMFEYLALNSKLFSVKSLDTIIPTLHAEQTESDLPIALLPLGSSVIRKCVQAVNRVYWV
jgi:hypothetical protein